MDHALFCRGGLDEEARIAQEVTPEGLIRVVETLIWRWLWDNGGITQEPGSAPKVDPVALDALLSRLRERVSSSFPEVQAEGGRIVHTPGVRFGKPRVEGTRITVADILGWLAGGMSEDAILADYPGLTREDIREALAYAARCLDSPFPAPLWVREARENADYALFSAAWGWLKEHGGTDRRGGDERPWLHQPTREGILALREHFEAQVLAQLEAETKEG